MRIQALVKEWFRCWDDGEYTKIPVSESFSHTSPYGTIEGRQAYLELVEQNKDKFLGNSIVLRDELYADQAAAVRYSITNEDFTMEVSEWIYAEDGLISRIVSYYNIEGEISDSRKLSGL